MSESKPVLELTEAQRGLIDPEVRRVKAMRMQTAAEGVKLDMMLSLIFPEWDSGKFIYDPETGAFHKKGAKLAKANDPLNRPHRGARLR